MAKDIGTIMTEAEGRRIVVTRVKKGVYQLTPAMTSVVTVTPMDLAEIASIVAGDSRTTLRRLPHKSRTK